ncbi:MAG TPA: SDR family oxidoreductase [Solirubrobacterales bacterium]|nr:SDR family oxidoreductase [Solirubrobacterales bacterium]
MSLRGKVLFVTGGARGIGAAVAAEAASRGARVALVGIEPEELEARAAELGEGHIHIEADVTDLDSMRGAADRTVDELGGIDMVLANAGIATYGSVENIDPEAFKRAIDVNVTGVFYTAHVAMPQLLANRGWFGVVGSIASYAPLPGGASYNASKAGVELFTRALRGEVGWRGVTAASIHPSWIDTAMVQEAGELSSFRERRERLPWPVRATTTPERCAELIVDGAEARKDRIFIPPSARLIFWLRNLLGSRFGEAIMARESPEIVPQMDAEIAQLGRSVSARNAEINRR